MAQTLLSLARGAVRGLPRRCLAALAILGAAAVGEEAAPAEATFTLQPVPDGFYLPVDIDLEEHEVHFKKTPDFQGPPTCGAIPLNESVSEFVGFAWDKAANLLYVDENRNLDLTDEPGVVYKSEFNTGNFTGVRFSVQHGELNISYVVDLRLSEPWFCMAVVRSGWKGRVEVNGTPYEVLLADNLDGDLTYEDSFTVKSASGVASAAKPPEEPDYWGLSLSSEKHGVARHVSLAGRTLAVQAEFALVDGAAPGRNQAGRQEHRRAGSLERRRILRLPLRGHPRRAAGTLSGGERRHGGRLADGRD
ncbi:MAG: hypothetical protein HYV26_18440 [Candidatus Hydrogenedentes bacterium]|nr:hypothetical protein [Candidatus Hydrogenedentota bacterium]